jgi:hypothetical protein
MRGDLRRFSVEECGGRESLALTGERVVFPGCGCNGPSGRLAPRGRVDELVQVIDHVHEYSELRSRAVQVPHRRAILELQQEINAIRQDRGGLASRGCVGCPGNGQGGRIRELDQGIDLIAEDGFRERVAIERGHRVHLTRSGCRATIRSL